MKLKHNFIALMLLFGATVFSQSIAVNTTDPKTGDRTILTRNHKGKEITIDDGIAKSGLAFFSVGYQKVNVNGKAVESFYIDLDMFHNNNKLGCINQSENNVTITLEDGTEIKCYQISDTDCHHEAYKAAFALTSKNGTFAEMEANFKKLQTVAIKRIKVSTTESVLDYKIKDASKDYIKAHFALVAKTLYGNIK